MEISPKKAALIHADIEKDKHKLRWRLCNYGNAHKISCDSRRLRPKRQYFACAWIKGVKKQSLFCYLPIRVLKDICTCQLHVILSHKRHGLHFVKIVLDLRQKFLSSN